MATHPGRLSAGPPAVVLERLSRRFGERTVLGGVDLRIPQGQFVALVGRSGSGKSTLLRALAGIDHDVAGEGRIEAPRRVSVVFQDSRLLPWRRVLENVLLGSRDKDSQGRTPAERGRAALAEVGLAGRERAWPSQLSGGEQQRAALARSLVWEPELLLADEPFGALDALTRIRMHGLLKRLSQAHHPAVLLVTHDVDEAIELADRVVVLEDGRIAANLDVRLPQAGPRRLEVFLDLRRQLLGLLGVEGELAGLR